MAQLNKLGSVSLFKPCPWNLYLYYWLPFLLRVDRDLILLNMAEANERTERITHTNGAKKSRKSWIATCFM
jgi:hypothetical protein